MFNETEMFFVHEMGYYIVFWKMVWSINVEKCSQNGTK